MEILIPDEQAQGALGERLARHLPARLTVFLDGDLGTGKTTLARGILRGLGHRGTVRSPTYTLIEPYEIGARRVYHLDLYRLCDPEELDYLGLRDLIAEDALLLVEWPQRGAGALPGPDLTIRLEYVAHGRRLTLTGESAAGRGLVESLARGGATAATDRP
jgi:tRNA threonylcarbamoyladenosine biosynthesis protein TsaE